MELTRRLTEQDLNNLPIYLLQNGTDSYIYIPPNYDPYFISLLISIKIVQK